MHEKKLLDECLMAFEDLRIRKKGTVEPTDFIIRVCEAIVAEKAGYTDRAAWRHLQTQG